MKLPWKVVPNKDPSTVGYKLTLDNGMNYFAYLDIHNQECSVQPYFVMECYYNSFRDMEEAVIKQIKKYENSLGKEKSKIEKYEGGIGKMLKYTVWPLSLFFDNNV